MNPKKNLAIKIESGSAHVAIIGMGYVGLPLALAFAKSGFKTTGIDISSERVKHIQIGRSYIDDVSDDELQEARKKHKLQATTGFQTLKSVDCVIICVPTPLGKTRQPDLSFVLSAVASVSKNAHSGQLVVLESTTYPGTTEENIRPMLEGPTRLKVGQDIFLGFSPERVDPGSRDFELRDIPKVVGGVERHSQELLQKLYQKVFREVVAVSDAKTAEMVKLLENTFRSVNIGLINEMAKVCHVLGINIWEVIRAATTKPFGFMPFYPGPGIGGHCINIDSMYLAWKARLHGLEPRLIELAQQINDEMPDRIVDRVNHILNKKGRPVKNSRIFVLGAAYKRNVSDTRESPSLEIMQRLGHLGAKLSYHDPFVPALSVNGKTYRSLALRKTTLKNQDLVLLLTDHGDVNYDLVAKSGKPVFDTRNVYQGQWSKNGSIVKL